MFEANLLPGQGFIPLSVYEATCAISGSGRAQSGKLKKTDKKILGIVTGASQKEIEQWKKNDHPITHKIIEYSAMKKAKATDYLIGEHDGVQYYVQGVKNPGNLNVTMIYYVEERFDIKKDVGE